MVAVPTPIDNARMPDFGPLRGASETVGAAMRRGATVVFESTVYPGVTEELCVPIIERASRLSWKKDFFVGYSPERINPGDKQHTLERIVKVVAGATPATVEKLAAPYGAIVPAGIRRASSIQAATSPREIRDHSLNRSARATRPVGGPFTSRVGRTATQSTSLRSKVRGSRWPGTGCRSRTWSR